MQTFIVLFALSCFAATANAQAATYGCNINFPQGSPVFINSTADLALYSTCTALPGVIFGSGNLTGNIDLPNLAKILTTTTNPVQSQTGIQILGAQATSITFSALTSFLGSFVRVINCPNLVTFSLGPTNTVVNNVGFSYGTQVVIQSNPNLVNPVVNLNTLGSAINSIVTVGADASQATSSGRTDATGATGTVSFPYLTTAYSVTIFSNGNSGLVANRALTVSLPAITSLVTGINAVGNDLLTTLTVGGASGFTLTNGAALGIVLNFNNYLTTVNLNGFTGPAGSIRVDTNGQASTPWTLSFDNLQYTKGVIASLSVLNNPGLTSISFAKARYVGNGVSIQNNPQLTNANLPGPIITAYLQFVNNGPSTPGCNAILGIQNATSAGVSVTGNNLNSLAFPQALYWTVAGMTNNVINGPVYANTTFVVATTFNFATAGGSSITTLDLSGLAYVGGGATIGSINGAGSTSSILLTQLQQVVGTFQLTSITGFDSISFNKLVSLGVVQATNNAFVTYDFGTSATNNWKATSIGITGTLMKTINFGNLVTVGAVQITINSNADSSITASKLTCATSFAVNDAGSSALGSVNLPLLTSFGLLNVLTGTGNCNIGIGGKTTPCGQGCYTCTAYSNNDVCNGNNRASTASGVPTLCSANADATTASTCAAASPYSFSTTTATIVDPTPTTTGGNGTPTNSLTTNNNNNGGNGGTPTVTSTLTNNNGGGGGGGGSATTPARTTSAGVLCSASVVAVAAAVAFAL